VLAMVSPPSRTFCRDLYRRDHEVSSRPVISQAFPMTQVVQAQDQIATGHTRGKIVLKICDEPVR
jgi:NADPH:quinone reductase-like Zn-dependent oxidoreductase